MAQVRTGTIWGHVTDTQGAPLPGVSVTLKSPFSAPMTAVTDEQGIFRFPSLEPSTNYALAAELQGFKKQEKTGVIVSLGQQSKIDLVLEQGKMEEEVTVVAVTPTVDAKKTAIGKNVTQDTLQSLPTSRDPWNVMQMAPSIIMDRENVGGSESGQQAGYVAKGDPTAGNNNVWSLDGVVVTDPAAIGASPTYWDFDAFEEMNIVTGGADVTVQTGGVALNMVTRRGGNKVSFGGRFYLTDDAFQANNLTAALQAEGVPGINKIIQIKDYGFNLGGPVWKDHLWLWGSYGIQDINALTMFGKPQKPTLADYTAKLNAQFIVSNRIEAMWMAGSKVFIGRSSSPGFPEGFDQGQPQHWGSPIIKIQDEQLVGNDLLFSAKYAYMNASFSLIPHSDPGMNHLALYDAAQGVSYDNSYYITTRPMHDLDFHVQYYDDKLFGVSHEIKLGVEYSTRRVTSETAYPGNIDLNYDLNYPDMWWADAPGSSSGHPGYTPGMQQWNLAEESNPDWSVKQLTAFAQDTITAKRFNFMLGLRFDHQVPYINSSTYGTVNSNPVWSENFDSAVTAALADFMRPLNVPNISPKYHWNVFSPRIGITYDLFGTGKTVLKLSGAMYGDFMGTGSSAYLFTPYNIPAYLGAPGAPNLYFWWLDTNGDGIVQPNEVWGNDPNTYAPIPLLKASGSTYAVNPDFINATQFNQWWGFVPFSGEPTASGYTVNSNAGSSRTWELLFSIDHELMPDFSVGLDATYRKFNHFSWDVPYYWNGPLGDYSVGSEPYMLQSSDYQWAGLIPSTISYTSGGQTYNVDVGTGAGHNYYLLTLPYSGTPYAYHELNSNYQTFWGIDLTFNKRLSNKWMLDGSISYMDQRMHYGNGILDTTNLWALQDNLYAPRIGASSGKIDASVFSHWMLKLEGFYQLPYDFNISFTFSARAGYPIPHYMDIVDYTWENANAHTVQTYLDVFPSTKLPTFYQLNLRLEKMVKLGDTGRIYIMADAFNVTNAAIINRRYDMNEGTLYVNVKDEEGNVTDYSFEPYPHRYQAYSILNPFIMRFGVRFQF